MFLLYNLLLTLLALFWVPWMLFRTWRRKEQPNWKERQGDYSKALPPRKGSLPRIWVHTVSVGEFIAATPILRELRKTLPGHEILVSVSTSSGHETARKSEVGLFDHLVYFPIDVARFQLAAMQAVQPDAVVVVETELWMNFLWAAKVFEARTLLVNGRISDRSYPRSLKIRPYYRALFRQVDQCLMQSETDRERVLALGAQQATVLGNCKFDQSAEFSPRDWATELGLASDRPIIVFGSIRAEEFDLIAQTIRLLGPENFQCIVAPRHLESARNLAPLLSGVTVAYRSEGSALPGAGILVLDTYGELASVYSVADVVVVGGGFANLGGQNIIQPLALGKPVLHGPHMQNFRDVAGMAERDGASLVCRDSGELTAQIQRLSADPVARRQMGDAARHLVESNSGAAARYAKAISEAVLSD